MSLTGSNISFYGEKRGEQRVILHNVNWLTYEQLLQDLSGQNSRLCFDEGTLEIMTPLPEHERVKHAVELILEFVADEFEMNLYCRGSTTFKRRDVQSGFEADSCFYIQNESKVLGKQGIDLSIDPPPDLIVEIDISRDSLSKFAIYHSFKVPEVWLYEGQSLQIHLLAEQSYRRASTSNAFRFLSDVEISKLLEKNQNTPSSEFRRLVKAWAKKMPSG
jgi:Uma2 family endonuclease